MRRTCFMKAAILGKKIGMTRVFSAGAGAIPATVVQAGPCPILQVKSKATDGYEAVQLGFDKKKPGRSTMQEIGHAKKSGGVPQRFVKEIRLETPTDKAAGEVVTVEIFDGVTFVDITGTTIGKGTQGVMKKWHFAGQEASHGVERKHRSAGSIGGQGGRGWGTAVKRGKKMPGRMGHVQRTARNQKLVAIDKERNLLVIEGSIPGPTGGYVVIARAKTKK